MNSQKNKIISILALTLLLTAPLFARAGTGTIDSTDKYAWSENIGWINFGTSEGNVTVTNNVLTGYAWNDTFGWINLAPTGSGVKNTSDGVLSGSAWGEMTGYIDFSGVTISPITGEFSGYANGTVIGRISFNCSNTDSCSSSDFKVKTNWTAASGGAQGSGSGGGGGGAPGSPVSSPLAPSTIKVIFAKAEDAITDATGKASDLTASIINNIKNLFGSDNSENGTGSTLENDTEPISSGSNPTDSGNYWNGNGIYPDASSFPQDDQSEDYGSIFGSDYGDESLESHSDNQILPANLTTDTKIKTSYLIIGVLLILGAWLIRKKIFG